jgi:hypothetical protein
MRQLPLTSVTLEYLDLSGINRTEVTLTSPEDWQHASDINLLASWLASSTDTDFLCRVPSGFEAPAAAMAALTP